VSGCRPLFPRGGLLVQVSSFARTHLLFLTDEESTYQIVGADEADVEKGRISITSPLSRALINKQAGDKVEVTTPRGHKAYEIIKVRFK